MLHVARSQHASLSSDSSIRSELWVLTAVMALQGRDGDGTHSQIGAAFAGANPHPPQARSAPLCSNLRMGSKDNTESQL